MICKDQAIILNRYDYSETSLIVNFFTREFGKVKCLVRGARKKNSSYEGQFSLFSYNRIVYYEKARSNFSILSECEMEEYFAPLRADLKRMAYASYFVELVSMVTRLANRDAAVFDTLLHSLRALCKEDEELVARTFEIKVLSTTGFMPRIQKCVVCGKRIYGTSGFSHIFGGTLCGGCLSMDSEALTLSSGTRALIIYMERRNFPHLSRLRVTPVMRKELKAALRGFIDFHIELRPRSLEFLGKLHSYEEPVRGVGEISEVIR